MYQYLPHKLPSGLQQATNCVQEKYWVDNYDFVFVSYIEKYFEYPKEGLQLSLEFYEQPINIPKE